MPEKRLFHATIKNEDNGKTDYEAFYEAHTVGDVRQDAGRRYTARGNNQAYTVKHETLTGNPTEFYNRLSEAEKRAAVKHEKVPGLGRRWEVQKDEDDSPFGIAAASNGGAFMQNDDDRVGLPADDDNYEPSEEEEMEHYRRMESGYDEDQDRDASYVEETDAQDAFEALAELEKNYPANMGIAPSYMYDPNNIDPAELSENAGDMIVLQSSPHPNFPRGVDYEHIDPLQKLPVQAIGGFDIPDENGIPTGTPTNPQPMTPKPQPGSGKLPKLEDLDGTLEQLRRDPSTYETNENEVVEVRSRCSNAGCLFI